MLAGLALGHLVPRVARAQPELAALAPAADAREAIALGPNGEVYAPDGQGAWVRTQPITVGDRIQHAGRAGSSVVVLAGGAVFRLAPNGWTAMRLAQRGTAVMSPGLDAVGAVGRRLVSLEKVQANGEPVVLARAPARITAIGSGRSGIVVATECGVFRVQGKKLRPIDRVSGRGSGRVERLISDRWALAERGALNLATGKLVAWPAGLRNTVAAAGPRDTLVAAGDTEAGLVLVTVKGASLSREAIPRAMSGVPVGVVVDERGRAVIALADGRLLVRERERGPWTEVPVREQLPSPRSGPAPARSGSPA